MLCVTEESKKPRHKTKMTFWTSYPNHRKPDEHDTFHDCRSPSFLTINHRSEVQTANPSAGKVTRTGSERDIYLSSDSDSFSSYSEYEQGQSVNHFLVVAKPNVADKTNNYGTFADGNDGHGKSHKKDTIDKNNSINFSTKMNNSNNHINDSNNNERNSNNNNRHIQSDDNGMNFTQNPIRASLNGDTPSNDNVRSRRHWLFGNVVIIEVVSFLYMFSVFTMLPVQQYYVIKRIWTSHPEYHKSKVLDKTADFNIFYSLAMNGTAIIPTIFYGIISDRFGRKLVMLVSLVACLAKMVTVCLLIHFESSVSMVTDYGFTTA